MTLRKRNAAQRMSFEEECDKVHELARNSSAKTDCCTPKAVKFMDSEKVIHVNTLATPQT